jgi:hypothetical protein
MFHVVARFSVSSYHARVFRSSFVRPSSSSELPLLRSSFRVFFVVPSLPYITLQDITSFASNLLWFPRLFHVSFYSLIYVFMAIVQTQTSQIYLYRVVVCNEFVWVGSTHQGFVRRSDREKRDEDSRGPAPRCRLNL